ncbi:redoxin domain-containing protein [Dokdonia ponticola]|uniref:Redoxin domain-containing protein n=1 Tax=Dokdonia ponticola TaxID=2041041 RepID=A0ABV9HSV3_9FLAO
MKKILVAIITVLIISCNEKPTTGFSLSGTTNGFEDGSLLYLDYDNKVLDSVEIKDNAFVFTTKLPKAPMKLWLHNKDFSNYTAFWAENKPMTLDATNTDFRNAMITGSESEKLSASLYKKIDTLPRSERQKLEMEFVKNNPSSIVSASMLSIYATTWGKEKTTELYEQFSKENKESEFGQEIARYIELNKQPKIGEQFVDFESENQIGQLKKLSDLKGKAVLLEFWASWCGPCRQENPNLVKTYKEFNPKGFEIFAVSLDQNKEDWLKAIQKDSLDWEHVSDLKGSRNEASLIYGVNGIPDNYLIAENGKIIGRNLRGEQLNEKLKEILE